MLFSAHILFAGLVLASLPHISLGCLTTERVFKVKVIPRNEYHRYDHWWRKGRSEYAAGAVVLNQMVRTKQYLIVV